MGSGIKKRTETTTALGRIAKLEQDILDIVTGYDESFKVVEERFRSVEELVTALIDIAGSDAVYASVTATRKKKQEQAVESAKAVLENAVKEGQLTAMEVLPNRETLEADADKSLRSRIIVVGRQLDTEGSVREPGYIQLTLVKVLEDLQLALADKRPGDTIPLPDGSFVLDQAFIASENQ